MPNGRPQPWTLSFLLVLLVTLISRSALTQTESPIRESANLYKEVLGHKDQLAWQSHEGDVLPGDLCRILLATCPATNLAFKIFGFPLEVSNASDPGALVLSWTTDADHPNLVMIASVENDRARFFLLSPEGGLLKAASRDKNGPWSLVANETVYAQFEQQRALWHQWIASLKPERLGAAVNGVSPDRRP